MLQQLIEQRLRAQHQLEVTWKLVINNRLTDAEFEAKFRYLANGAIPEDNITALCNMVDSVADMNDVSELVNLTLPNN